MASFTPPPSSQLQPFAVPGPEYQDPLESLAKLRQNRVQNMQVQQAQLKMQSQRGLMQVMAQAGNKPDKLMELATARGDILPDDLVALREHMIKAETDLANLDEKTRAKVAAHADLYGAMVMPNGEPVPVDQLPAINARAKAFGYFDTGKVTPLEGYSDAEEAKAHINANLGLGAIAKRKKEAADTAQSENAAAASRLAGQETGQKITKERREQMITELRGLPEDPKRPGVPTLGAWNKFISKYDDIDLPAQPTAKDIAKIVKSTVPEAQIPKYEMEANMAAQGMTGTTQWDQFLFQSARALGKTPGQLTAKEALDIQQKWKDMDQNPVMTALAETQKALANQVLRTQVSSFLTPEGIQDTARDLLAGRMSLDEIKALRASRTNQTNQIVTAARAMARAEGKELDLFDLEQQADFRDQTLKEFSSTLIGHAGGQRLALNTMVHHADLYQEVGAALKNGTFKPGNAIYNRVATMFGAAPPIQANLVARFLAGETGKIATGGVPAEGEINGILQSMGADASPEAIGAAGQTLLGIAAGRMVPLKALRDKARIQKYVDILDPDSREILQRRGFDPETMKPRAGGGNGKIPIPLKSGRTAYADTQEQADKFKRKNPTLVK